MTGTARVIVRAVPCLLLLAAWVDGRRTGTAVVLFGLGGRAAGVAVAGGAVVVGVTTLPIRPDWPWSALWLRPDPDEVTDPLSNLPDELDHSRHLGRFLVGTASHRSGRGIVLIAAAPAWFVTSAAAVSPLRSIVRLVRRRRRRRVGLCVACGYDLRGSAGGCPECGAGRADLGRPAFG